MVVGRFLGGERVDIKVIKKSQSECSFRFVNGSGKQTSGDKLQWFINSSGAVAVENFCVMNAICADNDHRAAS